MNFVAQLAACLSSVRVCRSRSRQTTRSTARPRPPCQSPDGGHALCRSGRALGAALDRLARGGCPVWRAVVPTLSQHDGPVVGGIAQRAGAGGARLAGAHARAERDASACGTAPGATADGLGTGTGGRGGRAVAEGRRPRGGRERSSMAVSLLALAAGDFRVSAAHRRALRALVRRRGLRKRDLVQAFASWETGLPLRRVRSVTSVADLVARVSRKYHG